MEQEKKILLTVDTGESQKTVKSLKKEISDLKDVILNLEKGSNEYNEAVEQLTISQRELNEVQALTKKTAVALDGSYDALVHQMGLLKKEWRATADEGRRAELGQEISKINQQLKDMDADLGNFQRNVGNYVSHWDGMPESLNEAGKGIKELRAEIKQYQTQVLNAEEGTKEWEDAMLNLANAQFQMRDMNEKSRYAVADLGEQLANVTGIASGVMSGFSAIQGAMVLCGAETENFEKTMLKLQSAMAIVQGLQGLEGLQDRVTGLVSSIKVAVKTMGKGGWIGVLIAVVTAITAVVSHLTIKNRKIKDGTKALEDYNKAANATVGNYAEEIAKIKILEKAATDVNRTYEDRIKASKGLLKILGEEVTDTKAMAVANGEYASSIDKVTEKLIQQARMEGALDLIKEKQKEILEQQVKVNERMTEAPTGWDKVQAGLVQGAMAAETNAPVVEVDAEDFKDAGVERQKEKLEQMKNDLETYVDNLFKDFEIDDILVGIGIETDTETVNEKVMTMQEALKTASEQIQQTLDEDIANLDFTVDVQNEDFIKAIDEKNKKLKESAQYQIALAQDTANREKQLLEVKKNQELAYVYQTITDTETLNSEIQKIEKKYADEEYLIEFEVKEKKLEILYEWRDKNTDARLGVLEIAQQIADAEVDIETEKWRKITEEAKEANKEAQEEAENTKKIWETNWEDFKDNWEDADWSGKLAMSTDVTAQAFANTADILNSLADLYEADGEMSEKEAKKVKNLRIATATMDMLTGIVGAISSVAGMGPVGWAMGALQAVSIGIMGAANIAKIKNTDTTGGGGGGGTAVTPDVQSYSSELPVNFTRNITTASEIDELNKPTKVYVLESDISDAMTKVSVRESESAF